MKQRRIGVRELAKKSGVPASTISKWIGANQEPKASALLKVSKALGVSMEVLIEGKSKQPDLDEKLISAMNSDFFQLFQGEFRITVERRKE